MHRPNHNSPIKKKKIDLSGNVHYDSILQEKISEELIGVDIHDYPNEYSLYESISNYYSYPIENIAIGHGATEIIERIIRLYKDRKFFIVGPTFEMVQVYCEINNVEYEIIDQEKLYELDEPDSILYVATPNGQTGVYIDPIELMDLKFHKVLLDRVYYNFAPESIFNPINNDSISIYSVSKSLGLAGLRVGWAVSSEENIKDLQQIRSNYITNTAATTIIPKVINETKDVVGRMLVTKKIIEENYDCVPAYGNFVIFKSPNKLTEKYGSRLTSRGYRMALLDMKAYKKDFNYE